MSALWSPSSAPNRLTSAPRTGAGTARQVPNADLAAAIAASMSATPAAGTSNRASPVIGDLAMMLGPVGGEIERPHRSRLSRARSLSSSVEETDSAIELIRADTTAATSSEVA